MPKVAVPVKCLDDKNVYMEIMNFVKTFFEKFIKIPLLKEFYPVLLENFLQLFDSCI